MNAEPIEVETVPQDKHNQAVTIRQHHEVGQALNASQITEKLRFIKQVMRENMTEGTDYGKVPGCGDKPGLFQPGAQKLSMTFQLNPEVRREEITDYQNYHRGYRIIVRVSNGAKFAEGVGECSTLESKYRFKSRSKSCPLCGKASVFRSKNGDGWFCWAKKGGCGANFLKGSDRSAQIEAQPEGKEEHDNPADHWNTVQKMAFKRAFVHAIINATNTSELWSQDLEDLAGNGVVNGDDHKTEQTDTGAPRNQQKPPPSNQPAEEVKPKGKTASVKHRDRMLQVILDAFDGDQAFALDFARKASILLPTEALGDWPLRFVPVDESQMNLLVKAMEDFANGGEAVKPFVNPEPEPPKDSQHKPEATTAKNGNGVDWRNFPVPFGKNAGKKLGELERNSLNWYAREFVVSDTFEGRDGKPVKKKPEAIEKDRAFRAALDAARAELGAEKEAQ